MRDYILIGIVGSVLIILFGVLGMERDKLLEAKWDDCVNMANKFIPDQNDTETRASFIKNCFQNR